MRYPILILMCVVWQPSRLGASPDLRTWTSGDGNYVVRAELVEVEGANVKLRKPDGSVISVPVEKLCKEDREFLAAQSAKQEPSDSDSDPQKAARAALEQLGLRVGSAGLVLLDEPKLGRLLRDAMNLRKNVAVAEAALVQQEKNLSDAEMKLTALLALNVNLNAQLANLRPGDATINNRLVGTINANQGQIDLLRQSLRQQANVITAARVAANEAREAFIQAILKTRTLADSLLAQYTNLMASDAAKAAVQQWNTASGKSLQLAQSRNFQQLVARLKSLEDAVLTEEIPLRRVGGGSLMVSVVIDGKYTQEMVLDSGANLLTLPRDVAEKCGILVKSDAPQIVMGLADGSRIRGHLLKIGSVRVGKFSAEDVDCAVLDVDSSNAPSLLGMSFLEHFKFQVDTAKGTLNMVQIREEEGGSREE